MDAQTEAHVRHVKEIKLQLPLKTHVSLHSMKLIRNQSIRDSVVAALDRFFQAHPLEAIGAPIPDDEPV
ncbi:MAG: hypothetical protein HYT80_00795 [Euryarchaeota archaeon]|nr:hypothetical protein [Euryarchaeota archaeon]